METSKIKDDFRIYFAVFFCLIALIILCLIYSNILDKTKRLEDISFYYKAFWCLAFTLLGFSLLILKVCINSIHDIPQPNENNSGVNNESEKTKETKNRWRYFSYYPIMLIVLALLAVTISIYQFKLNKMSYFEASALLSFFLGYFIDSLPNVVEKLGGKVGAKN